MPDGRNRVGVSLHSALISDLAIVTVVAAVTGMITRRLGQPNVLGYLFAGLIVGPYIPIPLFADPHRMQELAEVGVVLVMFAVGLEFRVRRLVDILPLSGLTACVQIGTLAWVGFAIGGWLDWTTPARICLGASLAISSTMVVSAVLRSRPVDSDVRSHVFGILVVQDVIAIVLMAVVTALASGQSVGVQSVGLLIGQLLGVVIVMLLFGLLILPRLVRYAVAKTDIETLVVLIAGAAFGFALVAQLFGYSVALGAFISGMVVSESGRGHAVEEAIEPLRSLFSAVFFVSIGMTVDPVIAWQYLPLAMLLCFAVIVAQFVSVTLGTLLTGGSLRRGIYSGLALGQIGELSFILATIAIGGGVLPEYTLPVLVTVATLTAFTTPQFLKRGDTIVAIIDHRLPDRLQHVLTSYQSFLRGARQSKTDMPNWRRPALAVLLDWTALVVIAIAHLTIIRRIDSSYIWMVNGVSIVIAAPFVLGLVRSGQRLLAAVNALTRSLYESTARAKAIEALLLLAVVLGVGLPTLVLLRPLVSGPWLEVVLLALILLTLLWVGWKMGAMGREHTSGVVRIALDIEDRLRESTSETIKSIPPSEPLHDIPSEHLREIKQSGVDYKRIDVPTNGGAAGKTLAELELRCRSGASVVAIIRASQLITLPTGHETLIAGDMLVVSGADEALERVETIMVSG